MVAELILETSFLVDLDREAEARSPGAAQQLLRDLATTRFFVTFTVAGELAAGYRASSRGRWEELLAPFHILPMTVETGWQYGRVYRHLRANGELIGSNDLWIAATALAHGLPLVTRNVRHFRRVPDLEVLSY